MLRHFELKRLLSLDVWGRPNLKALCAASPISDAICGYVVLLTSNLLQSALHYLQAIKGPIIECSYI
jgi:hypothetical protein